MPYVTGGIEDDWVDVVRAVADAGADAVEVGIPFSDPVMDGPVVQEASQRRSCGATPQSILDELRDVDAGIPIAVMTYYNIAFHMGHERFANALVRLESMLRSCRICPLEEAGPWCTAADAARVETVMLAAPTAPDERLPRVCERSRGFVYGVGLLGVTGERGAVSESALVIAKRLKAVTDKPVLVGVGVSTAEHARTLCEIADGVIVGSALVRRLLDGGGPAGAAAFVTELRQGLDRG